jgi:hypothetical protein
MAAGRMMMGTTAAVLAVLAVLVATASAGKPRWHELEGYTHADYERDFGKVYANAAERTMRRAVFERKVAEIRAHNADTSKTWKEGVNHFTDQTEEEFRTVLGYNKVVGHARRAQVQAKTLLGMTQRQKVAHVDWRDAGIVTAVKDQGAPPMPNTPQEEE